MNALVKPESLFGTPQAREGASRQPRNLGDGTIGRTRIGRIARMAIAITTTMLIALTPISCCGSQDASVCETAADIESLPSTDRSLRVRGIRDSDVAKLRRFACLESLDFYAGMARIPMRITSDGLRSIAEQRGPELRYLYIEHSHLMDDDALQAISGMRGLRGLQLRRVPNVSSAGLAKLAALRELRWLDIRANKHVDDAWVECLGSFDQLCEIRVADTGLTQIGLERLKRLIPGCVLDVRASPWDYALPEGAPYIDRVTGELLTPE